MNRLEMNTKDFNRENLVKIQELFPNCIVNGKIDFEILKQELLGELIETNKEKYQCRIFCST